MNISPDKLETKHLLEVLHAVQQALQKHAVDFFLIGAQARDIQLILHGEKAPRATRDVDIALTVPNLKTYNAIKLNLIEKFGFDAISGETPYRLRHKQSKIIVDLLPFGKISKAGVVQFDDRLQTKLLVSGLQEAYRSAQDMMLTDLRVKVATLPGIFVMKLLTWHGDPDSRERDINDLRHIVFNYFDMNQTEIYDKHFELLETLQPETAGAHLLGRHIKDLLARSAATRKKVLEILHENSRDPANSLLGEKMVAGTIRNVAEICNLLTELTKGIKEKHA